MYYNRHIFHPTFGSAITDMQYVNDTNKRYRYGFNGMEKSDQIFGEGNEYTTEFRQLDVRLGKWISLDPCVSHSQSPYIMMLNNVLNLIDKKGDTVIAIIDKQGAKGRGHMGLLLQDKWGSWCYATQGASEGVSFLKMICGMDVEGVVNYYPLLTPDGKPVKSLNVALNMMFNKKLSPDGTEYDDFVQFNTTKAEDIALEQKVKFSIIEYRNPLERKMYNMYSNNCADQVQDWLSNIITLPEETESAPNEYWFDFKYDVLKIKDPQMIPPKPENSSQSGLDNYVIINTSNQINTIVNSYHGDN